MNLNEDRSQTIKRPYMEATGALPHPLTNDYMFKALLQKNQKVLKHLICSLLHLRPDEVRSVQIRNPIVLGEALTGNFDSKVFVLDINVLLNDHTLINLEMQVINHENWPERSLTYLCRNFDQVSRGEDYSRVRPVVHIGFLDFTLFPDCPEFYATYKMINQKNRKILTDKFVLSVVDLKQVNLATPEDQEWQVDYWASLFKAATWEDMKMLAKQNAILEDAVETVYELTADEAVREQCKAREKHVREMMTVLGERARAEQERDKAEREKVKAEQEKARAEQEKTKAEQEKAQAIQALEQERQQAARLNQENTHLAQQLEQLQREYESLKEQQKST